MPLCLHFSFAAVLLWSCGGDWRATAAAVVAWALLAAAVSTLRESFFHFDFTSILHHDFTVFLFPLTITCGQTFGSFQVALRGRGW